MFPCLPWKDSHELEVLQSREVFCVASLTFCWCIAAYSLNWLQHKEQRSSTDTCYCICLIRMCQHFEFDHQNFMHPEKSSTKRMQELTCKVSGATSKHYMCSIFQFLVAGTGEKRMILTCFAQLDSEWGNTYYFSARILLERTDFFTRPGPQHVQLCSLVHKN